MFRARLNFFSVAVAAGLTSLPVVSQAQEPAPAVAAPFNQTFITHHQGQFGGQKVRYTATVSSTVLTDDAGKPTVNFVTTDYVREGVKDASKRPVIFAFAGGPSGASVAYHMRMYGPRQVFEQRFGDPSSAVLRDNPDSILDIADVVLVDPAETGFSRVLPGGKREYFYSVNGDTASIEQFINRWLKERKRENSPLYVAGGSYGSVRAVRIGWDLMKSRPVDGLIMTANSLMLQEMVGVVGTILPLPTMAAVAIFHGKADRRGRTDQQVFDDTYRFAIDEYLPALSRVQDLSPQERAAMAEKLHQITGLPAADILEKDLVITRDDFKTGLLKAEGRVLSDNLDGRSSILAAPGASKVADNANARLFRTYMRDELKVTYPMDQYALTAPETDNWDYRGPNGASRNDWPGMIREQMEANPRMRVFSANGLYDMQGVTGQAKWTVSRTKLPRERLTLREYVGGHGLYYDPATASQIMKDVRAMFAAAK